jgi:hypothetical protein
VKACAQTSFRLVLGQASGCYVRVFDTRANAHTRWLCTDYEAHTGSDLLLRSSRPGEWV